MSRISSAQLLLTLSLAGFMSGCGLAVPDHQEFWGTSSDVQDRVNNISNQVRCELRQSLGHLVDADEQLATAQHSQPHLKWLANWGAQVTLTLTIEEKSGLNPGVSLNTPLENATSIFSSGKVTTSQSFALGFGGNLSSDATRSSKLSFFYKLSDLIDEWRREPKTRPCIPSKPANANLFIESDLKLEEWLYAAVAVDYTDTARYGNEKDVISQDIKFEIVSSANVTPTWKLVRVSANTGNTPLFSTTRDRTQDLLITLGPLSKTAGKAGGGGVQLSTAAQNSHLAGEIGVEVGRAVRSGQ
jgi:hypothetical protein